MYYHYQIIKERFDIEIDSENQTHKAEFELDKMPALSPEF